MDNKISSLLKSRRQFLANILPTGTLFCFGCTNLLALSRSQKKSQAESEKHKFLHDSRMTYEQAFRFAYIQYINIMQMLSDEIGKDKFIAMLKKAASKVEAQNWKNYVEKLPKNDFDTFANIMETDPWGKQTLTLDIVEKTDHVLHLKVTECLWAKTFRDANAAEIGYASICYPDYAGAPAYNPKMKMVRTKTLMQGHDCCNHRFIWEE